MRISDVLTPKKSENQKLWFRSFQQISSKHFDYVLCDQSTLSIVAVIELDDKSHNTKKSRTRDSLIEAACSSASLPLIRFACKRTYQMQDIRNNIDGILS